MTPRTSLNVAQISFFNDPAGRLPEELLVAWPSLVDVADAVLPSRQPRIGGAGVHALSA